MATKPVQPAEAEATDNFYRAQFDAKLAEMQKKLDEVTAQLNEQSTMIKEKDTEIKTLKAGKSGWLITAPNPLYDGSTLGVQFINGQAFIPDDRVIPSLEQKPTKFDEKEVLTEKEKKDRAAIREREKVPTSVIAANMMQNDFGYVAQHFDGEDGSLQELLDARAKERSTLQAMLDAQSEGAAKANNLMQPTRFSGLSRG